MNSEFSSDLADILAIKPNHEMIVFTKFQKEQRKIVDFLSIVNFCACPLFSYTPSTYISNWDSLVLNPGETLLRRMGFVKTGVVGIAIGCTKKYPFKKIFSHEVQWCSI